MTSGFSPPQTQTPDSHCNGSRGCDLPFSWTDSPDFVCSFVKNNSDVCEGGGYLAYTQVLFCGHDPVYIWPFFTGFLVLLFQYFLALSIAADAFFCPSLAVIVDHLKISQNIAGVTFLAFGNGAPDIFAAIASVLSTKTPKFGLALGALLGAGMFLSTVIVAIVTLLKPFDVMRRPAMRDLGFFLLTVLYVFFILYNQRINLLESAAFIGLYVVYAVVVVVGRYIRVRMLRRSPSSNCMIIEEEEEGGEEGEDVVDERIVSPSSRPRPRMRRVDSVVEEANWRYDVFHSGSGASSRGRESTNVLAPNERNTWRVQFGLILGLFWKGVRPFHKAAWTDASWPHRAFLLLKSPVVIILNVTIPKVTLDEDSWCQPLTITQCVLSPLFALVAVRNSDYLIRGTFPLWVLLLIAGCILGLVVFLSSDIHTPPKYFKMLAYVGFLMSVLWIYSVATEVVGIITMIGAISGAPDEILGLTLLAWSNSLGDLISDISVARQGFPRMAISACFGGPLFNLLLGIGIPFTIASIRSAGHFFPVCFSSITLVLVGFLTWSLVSSIILLPVSRFHASRPYAAYLLVIYAAFLVIASLTATGVITRDYTQIR